MRSSSSWRSGSEAGAEVGTSHPRAFGVWTAIGALGIVAGYGCSGGTHLTCDDTMKTAFKPDANTSVVLVQAFKQGDPLALSGTMGTPPTAAADLCLVKMVVGPGFQDVSTTDPSTSPGIGIEVWLPTPSAWNNRIQNLGGGGWAGGNQANTTLIGSNAAAATAAVGGYAVGTTDTGHSDTMHGGSFAMKHDGSIDATLWTDFAERSLHELALKTKALVQGYYDKTAKYAYWNGCSTGGRQGYKIAQNHPTDYNAYLVGAPAFNWTKFITNELYPQIVMQRDLTPPGPIAGTKLDFMGGAAVSACDRVNNQHLGFILDTRVCRYDPTQDAAVLCTSVVAGNGCVGGASASTSCVNCAEAKAMNKIWYGQTADGTYPDPAIDNSSGVAPSSNQLWWGLTRGSSVAGLAGSNPFSIATDMVALELQDPTYATPSFVNATGNGMNKWRQLSYSMLASAFNQGVSLQSSFGNINTDNPDLSMARSSGAKIISYHGLNDVLIMPQGSINYFSRVSASVGGDTEVNKFNRLFLVPGMGHCAGIGSVNGSAGPILNSNNVPLPATNQLFGVLVDWLENNNAPASIVLSSADGSVTMPVCPYPQKATYNGSGSITAAASYSCN